MEDFLSRTRLLIGEDAVQRLQGARVAVFGLGGVGSFAAEALCRGGIGGFLLVDHDTVSESNRNRQLIATADTLGQLKSHVMARRMESVSPHVKVETSEKFCLPENAGQILEGEFDYIVDAIDTVSAKIALVQTAVQRGIPIISSMGTGNKLDPTRFRVADIYETDVCPLCRVMRRELRRLQIPSLKVVYSDEPPILPQAQPQNETQRKQPPGSVSFVPPVAGMILAGEVIRDLIGVQRNSKR